MKNIIVCAKDESNVPNVKNISTFHINSTKKEKNVHYYLVPAGDTARKSAMP